MGTKNETILCISVHPETILNRFQKDVYFIIWRWQASSNIRSNLTILNENICITGTITVYTTFWFAQQVQKDILQVDGFFPLSNCQLPSMT
jgi:hypothetical protein